MAFDENYHFPKSDRFWDATVRFRSLRTASQMALLAHDTGIAAMFQWDPLAGQLFQGWKRRRNCVRTLGNSRPVLERVRDHRDGLPRVRRHDHRGLERSGTHPRRPRLWQSVHAGIREPQPLLPLFQIGHALKSLSRADGHCVILRADQIDATFAGKIQTQPRGNAFVRTLLRPLPAHNSHLDIRGQGTLHPRGPVPRRGILRWPLNIEDGAAARKQRGKLPGLNFADFLVIGTDGKNGNARRLAQVREIFSFAVQHRPADSRAHRGARHLWQRSRSHRLEHNRIGTQFRSGLNGFQNLRALRNRVVVRVENLEIDAQTPRSFLRRGGLLQLVIVVAGGQRNEEAKLLHPVPFSCKEGSTFFPSSHPQEKEKLNRFMLCSFEKVPAPLSSQHLNAKSFIPMLPAAYNRMEGAPARKNQVLFYSAG